MDPRKDNPSSSKSNNGIAAILIWLALLAGFALFFNYLLGNIYNPNQKVISYVTEDCATLRL